MIVADGVNSRLRDSLDLIAERRTLVDGAIRMLVERTEEERISEEGRKYIEMWSGTRRILYTPCSDSELYLAFTMLNDDAEANHLPLNKDAWKRWFPQMEGVIERVGDQGHWDAFQYIRLRKWSKGYVAVIGDAAHALPPNIGQGGGCAMMNALSLATILSEYTDLEAGLADVLAQWQLPVATPAGMTPDQFMDLMSLDKKVQNGQLRLVLLRQLGEAVVTADYDAGALRQTLEAFCGT